MEKILTGSKEFFPENAKDADYICVDETQTETMKHTHDKGTCLFSYKPMTKAENLDWLTTKNGWALNNSPLITRKWLEHFGIEPFGADRSALIAIYKKWFDFCFRNTLQTWHKSAWHLVAFMYIMKNASFELTAEQKENALLFKQRKPSETAVKEIFEFFKA